MVVETHAFFTAATAGLASMACFDLRAWAPDVDSLPTDPETYVVAPICCRQPCRWLAQTRCTPIHQTRV